MSFLLLYFLNHIQAFLVLLVSSPLMCHVHILHRLKIRHIKRILKIIFQWVNSALYSSIVGSCDNLNLGFPGSFASVVLGCSTLQYEVGGNPPSLSVSFCFFCDLLGDSKSSGYFVSFDFSYCFNISISSGLFPFT